MLAFASHVSCASRMLWHFVYLSDTYVRVMLKEGMILVIGNDW